MCLIISLCCVNSVLVMPTPSVGLPSQDAGRNTSGKIVTWQQNWFDLEGAGELHLGLDQLGGAGELHLGFDQLGEAGSFGIAMPSLQNKVSFLLIKWPFISTHHFLCTHY